MPALATQGFRGINVTIPHKEPALALATQASASARAIGAANVLLFEPDGRIRAENTDAPSLSGALGAALDLRGATALVFGAGGSARAAVWALLDAGAREVRVWNRTPDRAQELGATLGAVAVTEAEPADVLVELHFCRAGRCTTAGAGLPLEPGHVGDYRVVVDFVYTDGGTPLLADARAAGVPTIDGLELLVGQGALSFELFTGSAAPVEVMCRAAGMLGADEHSTPAAGG